MKKVGFILIIVAFLAIIPVSAQVYDLRGQSEFIVSQAGPYYTVIDNYQESILFFSTNLNEALKWSMLTPSRSFITLSEGKFNLNPGVIEVSKTINIGSYTTLSGKQEKSPLWVDMDITFPVINVISNSTNFCIANLNIVHFSAFKYWDTIEQRLIELDLKRDGETE